MRFWGMWRWINQKTCLQKACHLFEKPGWNARGVKCYQAVQGSVKGTAWRHRSLWVREVARSQRVPWSLFERHPFPRKIFSVIYPTLIQITLPYHSRDTWLLSVFAAYRNTWVFIDLHVSLFNSVLTQTEIPWVQGGLICCCHHYIPNI